MDPMQSMSHEMDNEFATAIISSNLAKR
jgi:hypothetical protein